MKKIWGAVAFTTVLALQTPANAGVTIAVLGDGITSIGNHTETFNAPQVSLGPAVGGPGTDGGTYLGNGLVVFGSQSGVYAAPYFGPALGAAGQDPTQYLEVGPGNDPETITYSSPKSFFGLYWGSIDEYNTIKFLSGGVGGVQVASFTGADIIPLTANGNQTDYSSNRYVEFFFSGLTTYDTVVLGSSGPCPSSGNCNFPRGSTAAFEFDNVASAIPEPATWTLMLLGFAGIGFVAYRRTKRVALAAA